MERHFSLTWHNNNFKKERFFLQVSSPCNLAMSNHFTEFLYLFFFLRNQVFLSAHSLDVRNIILIISFALFVSFMRRKSAQKYIYIKKILPFPTCTIIESNNFESKKFHQKFM